METRSVFKIGGIASILLGILHVIVGIHYILLPDDQKLGVPGAELLPSFAANPTSLLIHIWEYTLIGIVGLAVIPAVFQLVRPVNEGWARLTQNLAFIGFAVAAVSNAITIDRLPRIAQAFVNGDASTQAAILPFWRTTIDPLGLWQFVAVGLWIFISAYLALRGNLLPRPLAYAGLLFGLVQWLVPLVFSFQAPVVFVPLAVLAVVLGPLWYIWLGLVLNRLASTH
jgi:hypothetical protein